MYLPYQIIIGILYAYISLNKTVIILKIMAPKESNIIRKCGLVGGSMSLLGWASRSFLLKLPSLWLSVNFLLPTRCGTLSSCTTLAACCHSPHCDDRGLNLWTCKWAPSLTVKCCPLWELPWSHCLFAALKTQTKKITHK